MVSVNVISVITTEYTTCYTEVYYPVNRLDILCCIHQPPDSYLTQLWIFIHHTYVSSIKSLSQY